jgi:hypothetical protein
MVVKAMVGYSGTVLLSRVGVEEDCEPTTG